MLYADCRTSKASPLGWLEYFLNEYEPSGKDKYVVLDQSGELYKNPNVKNLCKRFGYEIIVTGADTSFQNGLVERCHRSRSDATKAILHGAGMDIKFWSLVL